MGNGDDWSPDEPLGTETFEQGDDARDESSRVDPTFDEAVDVTPPWTRHSRRTIGSSKRSGPSSTILRYWRFSTAESMTPMELGSPPAELALPMTAAGISMPPDR